MLESSKWQPFSISGHCIALNQIGSNRQNRAGLFFARVTIHRRLPLRADRHFIFRAIKLLRDINDTIARASELNLRKIVDEMVIASMRVDNDDLLEAVA